MTAYLPWGFGVLGAALFALSLVLQARARGGSATNAPPARRLARSLGPFAREVNAGS